MYLTADEQLFFTKARCHFTQYVVSKPEKYGIKFLLLVDLSAKYLMNGFPYLRKEEVHPVDESLQEHVTLQWFLI
jgi:hypothetical protein